MSLFWLRIFFGAELAGDASHLTLQVPVAVGASSAGVLDPAESRVRGGRVPGRLRGHHAPPGALQRHQEGGERPSSETRSEV